LEYSWLRRTWNGNAVIDGAEGMEYQLTIDDINSSLVFMYTPITEEGVKGEPQCTMTDFVKAGKYFTTAILLVPFVTYLLTYLLPF
jgi:hypothetical protein